MIIYIVLYLWGKEIVPFHASAYMDSKAACKASEDTSRLFRINLETKLIEELECEITPIRIKVKK